MYSNSSVANDFAAFLTLSLDFVERDVPHAYARMCTALGPVRVGIEVDSNACELHGDGTRLSVARRPENALGRVDVRTTRVTLLSILDGDMSLVEAIRLGLVRLRGQLPALISFHRALDAYLRGCVRSPDVPILLEQFRSSKGEE